MCWRSEHANSITGDYTNPPTSFPFASLASSQLNNWFPFTRFERELLTELDIAAAQLHPNNWAFVRAFQIMCDHLGLPASVDVFLFLFEAKHPGDRCG